ncbi:hypothetical protein HRI_004711200 [Hibiscus trionum]|uniref:Uncharacterized protein n=1 Tax=Hibiscus trionum TaxID=183268 RepID=A0A9W7MT38_HIBTR|nr:hypothetical protein HRI_004711200 [Hibiscus trionum]
MVETAAENHVCSPLHLFKPYVLCVSILVPSIVLTCFLGLGFYVILFTTTVLISSTSFIVKFSQKTKVVLEDEVVQPVLVKNTVPDAARGAANGVLNEFQVDGSPDLTSESESSEDSDGELNWLVSVNMEQNPEKFDEYLTSEDEEEEDGLIEIAIPSNGTTGLNEEPKQNVQSNLPTFFPESIFQQQELVELLAEINEEENLIEIDISMGFIKCPAFEIEA